MLLPNVKSQRLFFTALLFPALFFAVILSGCNFVNLTPIGFDTFPSSGTILSRGTESLRVRFDTAMDRTETQKILSVSSALGNAKGELSWQGNELLWTPLEPWFPGVRYIMDLSGTLHARDGREDRISRQIPFYALSMDEAPWVTDFSPASGTSVGVVPGEGAFLRIVFSKAMDCESVSDALSLDGVSERDIRWDNGGTVLELYPKKKLEPWTVYHWKLGGKARGKNGVPLGKEASGCFVTDAERLLPVVEEAFPLMAGTGGFWWQRTGAGLQDGLGSGQAIGIAFNKAMDETAAKNIRFEPPLAGRTEFWKPEIIVFVPERDPEPERIYTLLVAQGSRDTGGLKTQAEFRFSFCADIPFLSVASLDTGRGEKKAEQYGRYDAPAAGPEGIVTVTIRFSHSLTLQARSSASMTFRLEPYFPASLKTLSLRSISWWNDDTAVIQWEGVEGNVPGESHYYRLVLPGGRNGISDGKGSYLKEETVYFLKGEKL